MSTFDYRTEQKNFNAAFSGLSAAQAADLILGGELTAAQKDALHYAQGSGGYGLRFDPAPVGHLGFAAVCSRGTGNNGWHLLVPATPECRRLVNSRRRELFALLLGAHRLVADRIFSEARGYEPALQAAASVWPLLSRCPSMSDRALREAGFRPGHPHEGAGIAAVRAALGAGA